MQLPSESQLPVAGLPTTRNNYVPGFTGIECFPYSTKLKICCAAVGSLRCRALAMKAVVNLELSLGLLATSGPGECDGP